MREPQWVEVEIRPGEKVIAIRAGGIHRMEGDPCIAYVMRTDAVVREATERGDLYAHRRVGITVEEKNGGTRFNVVQDPMEAHRPDIDKLDWHKFEGVMCQASSELRKRSQDREESWTEQVAEWFKRGKPVETE